MNEYGMIDRSEIESDPEQLAVYHILLEAWKSPANSSSKTSDSACRLHRLITSSIDIENCIWGSVYALNVFFRDEPSAIDFGINIFRTAVRKLPRPRQGSNKMSPIGAEGILRSFLHDAAQFFQGDASRDSLGKEDLDDPGVSDASNVILSKSEVTDNQPALLYRLQNWQEQRLDIIVLLAWLGRSWSTSFARQQPASLLYPINNAIEAGARQRRYNPRWSKADFVGACVLIRACAKSLLEELSEDTRDATMAYWKDGFTSFLHNDNGGRNIEEDFVVKIHAAASLRESV